MKANGDVAHKFPWPVVVHFANRSAHKAYFVYAQLFDFGERISPLVQISRLVDNVPECIATMSDT